MRKIIILTLIVFILFTSCKKNEEEKYERTDRTELKMDTVCTISVFTSKDASLLEEAFDLIDKYSRLIDMYDSSSEMAYVNENAYKGPVRLSDELFDLIRYAYSVTEYTNGAFNIAIGPLVRLWGIGTENAQIPSEKEIEKILELLNWREIVLDEENRTIEYLRPGMVIDLGAVGKGYVADKIASYLKSRGCTAAIINLGGNVYVIGNNREGKPWNIGIQNPDGSSGYFTTVQVSDGSVVTSGGYERNFTDSSGNLYHHILDCRTGFPSSSDLVSATIISSSSTLADMLSTACFVLGSADAASVVEHYGVGAILLTKDQRLIRIGV